MKQMNKCLVYIKEKSRKELVARYLDGLGRYQTATDLASSQVFNLFFATLVNTAIVYNLVGHIQKYLAV